jgi:(E)-4-hydroxy-3-methylbut-2-enyl-diphosphate synthase
MSAYPRRPSLAVRVGATVIGGGHPIVVQSMTNTDTADVEGTAQQVQVARPRRFRAGARHGQYR